MNRIGVSGHGSPLRHCARRLAPSPEPSFGLLLFIEAQASISVPSTEK
jgi:hypothetical protein